MNVTAEAWIYVGVAGNFVTLTPTDDYPTKCNFISSSNECLIQIDNHHQNEHLLLELIDFENIAESVDFGVMMLSYTVDVRV